MTTPDITLLPNFVADADALFAALQRDVQWDERMRARKTASFGVPYNYSQITYPEAPIPDTLDALCASIEGALGFRPNNCLLNFYADGESSMGFHSDTSVGLAPDTGVAIVSLGAQRSIVFRHKADKAIEIDVPLPHGSLLHMPDSMQALWLHAIPKTPGARARISVTFRKIA